MRFSLAKSAGKCYTVDDKGKMKKEGGMNDGYFRLLAIGDVVGDSGTETVRKHLWSVRKELCADLTVLNGENAASGNGLLPETADELFRSGADIITGGNHTFRRRELYSYLDDCETLLRPANYPSSCPGSGYCIRPFSGLRVLVLNLLGTVYTESLENPFETADRIFERERGNFDLAVCDLHAEATSEKIAFAYDFDGKITAVFGTHTHVQTNDPTVLPNGSGFLTDLGMTGDRDSVLGVRKENVIRKFRTKMPVRFDQATGKDTVLCGALFTVDKNTKKTVRVELVRRTYTL